MRIPLMPEKKRGRPKKPLRKPGRPIGSGVKRTNLDNDIRKAWREYYRIVQKPKREKRKGR